MVEGDPKRSRELNIVLFEDFPKSEPIVLCERCGERNTLDERAPVYVKIYEEDALDADELLLCAICTDEVAAEEFETDVLDTIRDRLGLEEDDREALRSFIETVFTDPKKILQVKDLDNRVRSLERQANVLWVVVGVVVALLAIVATYPRGFGSSLASR